VFSQHGKSCSVLCSFSLEPEKKIWFPLAGSNWIPGTRNTEAPATLLAQGLRCLEIPSFFSLLSFQHCEGDALHWSDPLRKWELWRQWFSHCGHCSTPACVLSVRYWWSMWTGLLHECPINRPHCQDSELGQVFVFTAWQKLFKAGLILAWTGKGNMISSSW